MVNRVKSPEETVNPALLALLDAVKQGKNLRGSVYCGLILPSAPKSQIEEHPRLVLLPHKTRASKDITTCLVVKDPAHKTGKKVDNAPETAGLFDEVVGVGALRRRVRSKRAAEEFQKSFAYLFVQPEVDRPLREALGLHFYKTSRHLPIVLALSKEPQGEFDPALVKYQVKRTLRCSQLVLRGAPFGSVLAGHTSMDPIKLNDNIKAVYEYMKKEFPGARMQIKTAESTSLEISY